MTAAGDGATTHDQRYTDADIVAARLRVKLDRDLGDATPRAIVELADLRLPSEGLQR